MALVSNKGFTLIELFVIVIIIGILASVGIPKFIHASRRAKLQELQTQINKATTLDEIKNVIANWNAQCKKLEGANLGEQFILESNEVRDNAILKLKRLNSIDSNTKKDYISPTSINETKDTILHTEEKVVNDFLNEPW